ncbi:type VII secretion protein EssB/YukC [Fictibacillus gelatini]|nr:type VII secretion protein EssB/YukC [Fictibacillus gelatini]
MKPQMFGDGTLTVNGNQVIYDIPRQKVRIESLDELRVLRQEHSMFLPVTDLRQDDHYLKIVYEVPEGYHPFNLLKRKGDFLLKLMISEDILEIRHLEDELTTIIHPNNIFYSGVGKVKFMYKAIKDVMPANGFKAIPLMFQLQALILSLFTKKDYNEIKNQGFEPFASVKDEIVQSIIKAQSIEGLQQAIAHFREQEQQRVLAKQEKKGKGIKMPGAAALFAIMIGAATGGIGTHLVEVQPIKSGLQADLKESKKKQQQQEMLLEGYRLAAAHKPQEAIKKFESVHGLTKDDKEILSHQYFLLDNPEAWETAAKLNPALKDDVAKKQLEKKISDIEQAFKQKDYNKAIDLAKGVNDQRAKKLVGESYLEKGDIETAWKVATDIKDVPLQIKVQEAYLKKVDSDKKLSKDKKKKKMDAIKKRIKNLKKR